MHQHTQELIDTLNRMGDNFPAECKRIADHIHGTSTRNGVLIAGNGGSAAEAAHFAAELNGRYKSDNRGTYPAIDLSADHATVTAIANDYGYNQVFAQQVETFRHAGLLVVMSTSGESLNLLNAVMKVQYVVKKMKVATLTGRNGTLAGRGDFNIRVPSKDTAVIQEVHLHAIHLICEYLEPA